MKYEADLHNHSTYSDGEDSPRELVERAKRLGLRAIGLTDHDTMAGLDEFLEAGRGSDIETVPGLEITVCFRETFFTGSLHYLIYFSEALLSLGEFRRETKKVLSEGRGSGLVKRRVAALNEQFGPVGLKPVFPEELKAEQIFNRSDNATRRHFALTLKEDFGLGEAEVREMIGNASPAYVPSGVPLERLRDYARNYPIIRILAHPAAGSYPGESHYKEVLPAYETVERLLPRFLEIGLDGFEVEYPGHTAEYKKILRNKLDDLGLLLETGGSDTHDHKERPLGKTGVPYSTVEKMQALIKKREREYGLCR